MDSPIKVYHMDDTNNIGNIDGRWAWFYFHGDIESHVADCGFATADLCGSSLPTPAFHGKTAALVYGKECTLYSWPTHMTDNESGERVYRGLIVADDDKLGNAQAAKHLSKRSSCL